MNGPEPQSDDEMWVALRATNPVRSLIALVEEWKANGCTKEFAERRLTGFLDEVMAHGDADQDDPVRDVLDLVAGYCSPHAKLFP